VVCCWRLLSLRLGLTPLPASPTLLPPLLPCSEQRLQFEDWRTLHEALAARCVLATPLLVAQQVVGALLLASSDPAAFAE
jgi:GAF domain-containing protein